MNPLALYGFFRNRPVWFVKYRGLNWLRSGFCPCCYSSPPQADCPVCRGYEFYGSTLQPSMRELWLERWLTRVTERR